MEKSEKSAASDPRSLELPVLPLRDVVVYPHMVIPLFVGREKSIRALDVAMEGDKQILLVAQRSPDVDDPRESDLHAVGTLATLLQLLKLPDGTIKVLVEGAARADIQGYRDVDGVLVGKVKSLDPVYSRSEREIEVVSRSLVSTFEQFVKLNRKVPQELLATLAGIDDPSRLADTIAAHLSIRLADKQRLLEMVDVGDRFEALMGFVDGEIDVQQIEKRIRGRVKSQMEKSQREYYLNEQMKAIQKELGDLEETPNELDELARKINEAGRDQGARGAQQAQADVADVGRGDGRAQLHRLARRSAVEEGEQGAQGPQGCAGRARRRSLRSREGQGTHPRVPRRAAARQQDEGSYPLSGWTAGCGQDESGSVDRKGDEPQIRAHVTGWRAR
jgi:ATP-dependent Lon protease